ncbi:hypothetical protein NM208_g10531 [Fusarium decemcellulare]|uniref:Uncharacterized protein n=1 Tax=Fusarium decemcellulare TaxID=57161 RepID=A0ACC1RXI9_9HYPO|nr:hypothetical protein NM208_g10531 [Fusarium decemcellulare]
MQVTRYTRVSVTLFQQVGCWRVVERGTGSTLLQQAKAVCGKRVTSAVEHEAELQGCNVDWTQRNSGGFPSEALLSPWAESKLVGQPGMRGRAIRSSQMDGVAKAGDVSIIVRIGRGDGRDHRDTGEEEKELILGGSYDIIVWGVEPDQQGCIWTMDASWRHHNQGMMACCLAWL